MPISISSNDFNCGHVAHSEPFPTLNDYGPEIDQDDFNPNDDLLDNILAFLDEQNSSSQLYSPNISSRCSLTPHCIKQWVDGLPTNSNTKPALCLPSWPLQTDDISPASDTSISSLPLMSVFSDVDERKDFLHSPCSSNASGTPVRKTNGRPHITRPSIVTDLIPPSGPEPTVPLPALPMRSPGRILRQRQTAQMTTSPSNNKKTLSLPDLKRHIRHNSQTPKVDLASPKVSLTAGRQMRSQRSALPSSPSLSEFEFPFPPLHNNSTDCESVNEESIKNVIEERKLNSPFQTKSSSNGGISPTLKLFPPQSEDTNNCNYRKTKMYDTESGKNSSLSIPILKTSQPFSHKKSLHSRSYSHSLAKANTLTSTKPYLNYRISANSMLSRISLSSPSTEDNAEATQRKEGAVFEVKSAQNEDLDVKTGIRAKTESVADLMRKNAAPGIRLGMRLMAEKRELLNACRVTGTEPRLLTVRRRSLTGTKVEWLVIDNGMAVRQNIDCGRLVLRCLGESDGKTDFFTAEGIPIFRFQRTVGSTRTAISVHRDHDSTYFHVRDGSWDCSVNWEVCLLNEKKHRTEKWLVQGDDQMQGLDIKQGDRIIGIIRDSGDHEFTLKVYPEINWCIITALATFFDEWRAARVGLAL